MSTSPLPDAGKRRSGRNIFRRSSLNPSTLLPVQDGQSPEKKTLRKKNRLSAPFNVHTQDHGSSKSSSEGLIASAREEKLPGSASGSASGSGSPSTRGGLSRKGTGRTSSLFDSLKSLRGNEDDTPPATANSASSRTTSLMWKDFNSQENLAVDIGKSRNILHHGEAQTNSGLLWKKKEYIVLTETHLLRFKSQSKAAETFPSIPVPTGRTGTIIRHSSSASIERIDSSQDIQSFNSELSGDRIAGIRLEQLVAVHLPEDGRHAFCVDVSYLDGEAGQGNTITLQLYDSDERDVWLRALRDAANRIRLRDAEPIPPRLAEYAARVVEQENDYDIANFKIYKITKRASTKTSTRSGSDDSMKVASAVCLLVIGSFKVHIIHLPKSVFRGSSPALSDLRESGSFGTLTLTWISVSATDDSFSLAFRSPFQKPKAFILASLASTEIALQLRQRDAILRPEWTQRSFAFTVSPKIEDEILSVKGSEQLDHNGFDRTVVAYCVAYNIDPSSIRYTINYTTEDAPRFELLHPLSGRGYSALQLLAIMRSLRYNESFCSISFAGINLDVINGVYDRHGFEHVCMHTKAGTPLKMKIEEQQAANILVQEVRALALGSKRLRRLDFSYCLTSHTTEPTSDKIPHPTSSGVLEALCPVCKDQVTNVDWIVLNGVALTESDLDYLVSMAVEKTCHFRAIEANRCGLTDRGLSLLLDSLRAQGNTLETIDIANNTLRLVPSALSRQLDAFGFIRKLDLSNLAVTATSEPLLPLETLVVWRLEDLRLCGIALNDQTVENICGYLAHAQSEVLRELHLANCSLSGKKVALLMQSMTQEPGTARFLHLEVSDNRLSDKHERLVAAIARGFAPTHVSMRSIEFELEDVYREFLLAIGANKSMRYLDLARISLPAEAGEETCKALENVFVENQTLEDLDISGEDSRLEISKIGIGINQALNGLKYNNSIQILRIQYQRLGMQGASTLGDVLKENTTLRELHCEHNGITLSGFTDIVNSLAVNTTLLYLPNLEEGREAAIRQTQQQITESRIRHDGTTLGTTSSRIASMRRSFATRGTSKLNASKTAPVPEWTEQDVQAALRLINEGWQKQVVRLERYIERNWNISQGLPISEEDAAELEEPPQRPGTAVSISNILEKVKIESTPTVEKQIELGSEEVVSQNGSALSDENTLPTEALLAFGPLPDIDSTPVFEKDEFLTVGDEEAAEELAMRRKSTQSPPQLDKALPARPAAPRMELKLPPLKRNTLSPPPDRPES